jgi:triphosphoribosyl-dephospho-CoA synthetase
VAIIVVDAQLATGSRLRAADETTRERNLASEERQRADRERYLTSEERWRAEQRENEADRERNRAAEARDRQAQNLECIRQAAVLSARVQLDPSDTNRARLQTFLNLLSQTAPVDPDL